MAYPGYQNSLLLNHFREFYAKLAELKDLALRRTPGSLARGAANAGEIARQLLEILKTQELRATRSGGVFANKVYREAQYIMAALADEFFLNEPWPGRESWPLLEIQLFQSSEAGELIFRNVERLLQQRDPVYVDLAAVYFFALSLGFQGKFRGNDQTGKIEFYKKQLFAMVFRHNPELGEEDHRLFGQSYAHTLSEGRAMKLPHPRNWILTAVGIILLWLAISHLLWVKVSSPIANELCNIDAKACAGGKQ